MVFELEDLIQTNLWGCRDNTS